MARTTFSTANLPGQQQLDAWCGWFDGVYDVACPQGPAAGFVANTTIWSLDGASFAHVHAPALRAERDKRLLNRNPIDHWVVGMGLAAETAVGCRDAAFRIASRVPFLLSLGDCSLSERTADERLHLYLPRDRFAHVAPLLDAVRGQPLQGPAAAMLRDYLLMLHRHLPDMAEEGLPPLTEAVGAMVAACIAPSRDRVSEASDQIDAVRLERARQAIRRNLRSARLGPEMLCRALGTSRSQLYRLFQPEGGVARYIQRARLRAVHAALSDPMEPRPIAAVAEDYGFYDPSSFSRGFRKEFGVSPREVRLGGLVPRRMAAPGPGIRLRDCLRDL